VAPGSVTRPGVAGAVAEVASDVLAAGGPGAGGPGAALVDPPLVAGLPRLFQPHDVRSLRDRAYDDIREAILTGALRPGERIKERDVAAQMGISTTPVKEALRRLEQEGLVVSQPRRGAVVGPLVLTAPEEILEIRAHLEGLAARFAAERMTAADKQALSGELDELESLNRETTDSDTIASATNAFHHSIRDGAGSVFLDRFLDTLAPFDRTIRVRSTLDKDEAATDVKEHRAMVEAINDGDGDAAERVMHEHISRVIAFHARWTGGVATKRRSSKAR
jgi:DNA-binding GntR family transcriptional regulator